LSLYVKAPPPKGGRVTVHTPARKHTVNKLL